MWTWWHWTVYPCSAALLCAMMIPLAMILAPHIGAVDIPGNARRIHTHPVPRCGGMAMFVAFWSVCTLLGGMSDSLLPLLSAGTLLMLTGLFDDVYGLPAGWKLAVQLFGAVLVLKDFSFSHVGLFPIATLWLCLVTNAHNMIDGLDGLCASVLAAEFGGSAGILMLYGDILGASVALVALGCCFGYLPFNLHPAKIFMGDEGALFFGFLLGWLSLRANAVTGKISVLLLLCLVPMGDLICAVTRRVLHGKNPLCADRAHWHHRLCDAGLGQRAVCGLLYSFSLVSAALAGALA